MKKVITIFMSFIGLSFAGFSVAKHFWRGETMSQSKVEKKWGSSPLNLEEFRNGELKSRAKMAFSLLKDQKKFFGKDVWEVRKEFGDPDGFYFKDMFPAYIIDEGVGEDPDTWQVVFMLDKHNKVSEIIVHKNCCDRN